MMDQLDRAHIDTPRQFRMRDYRLLRARLGPDYDPDRHLGGAVYVFLRGLNGPDAGAVFERPATGLITALDELFVPGGHDAG